MASAVAPAARISSTIPGFLAKGVHVRGSETGTSCGQHREDLSLIGSQIVEVRRRRGHGRAEPGARGLTRRISASSLPALVPGASDPARGRRAVCDRQRQPRLTGGCSSSALSSDRKTSTNRPPGILASNPQATRGGGPASPPSPEAASHGRMILPRAKRCSSTRPADHSVWLRCPTPSHHRTGLEPWILVPAGAVAAASGRFTLALGARRPRLRSRLGPRSLANLKAARTLLAGDRRRRRWAWAYSPSRSHSSPGN